MENSKLDKEGFNKVIDTINLICMFLAIALIIADNYLYGSLLGALIVFYNFFLHPLIKLIKETSREEFSLKLTIKTFIYMLLSSILIYCLYIIFFGSDDTFEKYKYFIHYYFISVVFLLIYCSIIVTIKPLIKSIINRKKVISCIAMIVFNIVVLFQFAMPVINMIYAFEPIPLYEVRAQSFIDYFNGKKYTFIDNSNKERLNEFNKMMENIQVIPLSIGEQMRTPLNEDKPYCQFYYEVETKNGNKNKYATLTKDVILLGSRTSPPISTGVWNTTNVKKYRIQLEDSLYSIDKVFGLFDEID